MKRELKYIDIEKLERLAGIISNVLKISKIENSGKRKRGRPKIYSDEFILLLLLL